MKKIEIRESMIPDAELIKRWSGLSVEDLADGIYSVFYGEPSQPPFPKPYTVHKILRNELEQHIFYCDAEQKLPYHKQESGEYSWELNIFFKLSDIEIYENAHPEVKYQRVYTEDELVAMTPNYVPADDLREVEDLSPVQTVDYLRRHKNDLPLFGTDVDYEKYKFPDMQENFHLTDDDRDFFYNRASREAAAQMLARLCLHTKDVRKHRGKDIHLDSENQLAEAQQKIASLEEQLAAAKAKPKYAEADPPSTVNAALWESSVQAAFTVWAEIVQGDKADWKEREFRDAIKKQGRDYHTKVLFLAWKLLPDNFKHGPGRPKNPPKTSNSLEP
jgi:hypothetical protein